MSTLKIDVYFESRRLLFQSTRRIHPAIYRRFLVLLLILILNPIK